ncbi:MAG: thioesterase-like protein [Alphaproteobacteria bacterium]|nr:MAG: thioesterase-like protein [Alphaproteobacteria bacterium]
MSAAAPLELHSEVVRPEWIDYNGHMNVAYYVLAFDHACDAFLDHVGLDAAYRTRTGGTTFAVECHITYQREVAAGDPLRFTTQLLAYDEKRIHHFHCMYHAREGYLAATAEWMSLHVDLTTRRVAPMAPEVQTRLADIYAVHSTLARPPEAGRAVGMAPPGRT